MVAPRLNLGSKVEQRWDNPHILPYILSTQLQPPPFQYGYGRLPLPSSVVPVRSKWQDNRDGPDSWEYARSSSHGE